MSRLDPDGKIRAELRALQAVPAMAAERPPADKPAPSRHAKPAKVGTRLLVAQATLWSIDDERTRAWAERYRGRLIDVEAMLAAPEVPITWRVDRLARDGYHTIIAGGAGVHKTWFQLAMQHAVVNGDSIGDMGCRGGPGLHFDAEVGAHGFKSRHHASGYGHGVQLVDARGLDLSRQDDQDWMAEVIAQYIDRDEGGLVTYDSLRALTPGAKENDSDDMVPVVRGLTNVARDTGAAIVGIHHSGWDTARMRGSSGIFDQCDAASSWRAATEGGAIAKSEDEAGFERWLICKPGAAGQKFNIGPAPKTRRFRFDEVTCRIMGVDEVEPQQVEPWENRILRVVEAGKVTRKSRAAAATALECSNGGGTPFAKAWDAMVAAQHVIWNTDAARYQLAEGVEVPADPNRDDVAI